MIDVRDTHRQAMEKADQAVAANKAGEMETARVLFAEACGLESAAAESLMDELEAEPTRSVLFRSAASLAVQARQFAYAAYLVASGLEGSPPQEIREELRDLLQTVRRDGKPEPTANQELRPSDQVGRYLSSCAYLQAAADRVRMALADTELKGQKLAGSVTKAVLTSTNNSLRVFTGDTSLNVDLFCYGTAGLAEYVPVYPVGPFPGDWDQFAKHFVFEHEDVLLRSKPIAGQIDELLREGALSGQWAAAAREAGIQALAAYPVCAVNEEQTYQPALVLLALASQETAFADELARQIMLETVSLLEIVIQIGERDEIFKLRIKSDEETDQQSEKSQIRGRGEEN